MKTTHKRNPLGVALVVALAVISTSSFAADIAPADARAIAKEAYIYGYPLVDSYRIQHAYFVNTASPEFKAPWNQLRNIPRVYTPEDKAVQVPNSDTPYSMVGLDLRAEPIVLTLPPIAKERYFSVQFIDAYTHNFAYLGSRATGNGGGSFLIAGPDWKDETPPGISKVTDHWRFDASLNLFMAGLSGDVTAHGIPAKVDAGFGDIWENLKGAAAGRFTVGYDRWLLSTEFSYMKLGASVPAASVELTQWLVEPTLGYRFCDYLQGFAGVRYNSLSGDVTFHGPLGKVATGTQDWWDPIVGTQLSLPLIGQKLTLDGRFDIGGFGVGSNLTWQAYPYLNWHFTKWGSAQLGYRWLATDYETGSGANKFRYDVIVQGPQVGLTLCF